MSEKTQAEITAEIVAQAAKVTATAVSEAAIAAAAVIARAHQTVATDVAVIQAEMTGLKDKMTSFSCGMDKMFLKLEEISLGRPTWAVTIVMGGLSSLCVGLIVFIMAHK